MPKLRSRVTVLLRVLRVLRTPAIRRIHRAVLLRCRRQLALGRLETAAAAAAVKLLVGVPIAATAAGTGTATWIVFAVAGVPGLWAVRPVVPAIWHRAVRRGLARWLVRRLAAGPLGVVSR